MLRDDVAALVQQGVGRRAFHFGSKPAVRHLDKHLRFGIDGINAHGERVDAAGDFGVVLAHSRHIADLVRLGFHTRDDTAQIPGLIDTTEIVAEVGVVFLIAGAVAENDLRYSLARLSMVSM